MLSKELVYFFSSAEANGAIISTGNKAEGRKDEFSVQLNNPLAIPHDAMNCTIEVTAAAIWNTTPNVSAKIGNNKFYLSLEENESQVNVIITIPDGLYGVSELEATIKRGLVTLGKNPDLVSFIQDEATQKLILSLLPYAQVDFTQPDTPRGVLGFDSRLAPLTLQGTNSLEDADSEAAFNRTNSYLIKSDIVGNGIPINSLADGILAQVAIDVKPGSQINYRPYYPPKSNANELIGHVKNYFSFSLVDQINREVSTSNEEWSFTTVIRYNMPVVNRYTGSRR